MGTNPVVVNLFDRTGNMVRPWAEAGYQCWCIDLHNTNRRKLAQFDPCDYGGYLDPIGDEYTKRTCLWEWLEHSEIRCLTNDSFAKKTALAHIRIRSESNVNECEQRAKR